MKIKQLHLVQRPDGPPTEENFCCREVELPALREGQALIENMWMSVDPYMRRSMEAQATDIEPWPLNAPLNGPAIGRIIDSKNADFSVGDIVESMAGWQSHFISECDEYVPYISKDTAIIKRTGANGAEPKDYLGLLGVASQTGYFGMMRAAKLTAGETVVVSSGAGTVGSVACQIAKIHGMRLVTSAGADEKVDWLKTEIGADYAFNYKTKTFHDAFREGCPNGIDLVLENATPEHLSACLPFMNESKLILIAGFVGLYNTGGKVRIIENFEYVLDRFLTVKSYPFMDYLDAYDQFVEDMTSWRRLGKMKFREQRHEGLETAPLALARLLAGKQNGKPLVKLAN